MKRSAKTAKRNRAQVLENKQSREIADSQPVMISMAYDEPHETFRFAWRNERFVLSVFGSVLARSANSTTGRQSRSNRRIWRRRLWSSHGSKMAPQAPVCLFAAVR